MDLEVWCFIAQEWKYFSIVIISCSGLLWTLLDQEERLDGIISFQTKRIIFFLNDQYIEQQIPVSTKNKTKSPSDLHSHLSTHTHPQTLLGRIQTHYTSACHGSPKVKTWQGRGFHPLMKKRQILLSWTGIGTSHFHRRNKLNLSNSQRNLPSVLLHFSLVHPYIFPHSIGWCFSLRLGRV